jgi:hypothetical protein
MSDDEIKSKDKEVDNLRRREKRERKEKKATAKAAASATSTNPFANLNMAGVAILLMFVLPLLLTGFIYISDYLNPGLEESRLIRQRLVTCYDAADPSKLSNIDTIMTKYKGREHQLFARLNEKYSKVSQCH